MAWNLSWAAGSFGFLSLFRGFAGQQRLCNSAGMVLTWVVDDGKFSVGLFDLELGCRWLDAKLVIVGRVDHHRALWIRCRV